MAPAGCTGRHDKVPPLSREEIFYETLSLRAGVRWVLDKAKGEGDCPLQGDEGWAGSPPREGRARVTPEVGTRP